MLCVIGCTGKVERHVRLAAHDPGIVPGGNVEHLTSMQFDDFSIGHSRSGNRIAPFQHVQSCILSDPGFSPRAQTIANRVHKWPSRSSCRRCVRVQTCPSQKCESHRVFRSASKQFPASRPPLDRERFAANLFVSANCPACDFPVCK